MVDAGAGGFVKGFSIVIFRSALLPCWLSSVMAAWIVFGSADTTLTGIFSLTDSPLESFCLLWIVCQTFSAASLLQVGPASRYCRMYSQSLQESVAGSLSLTTLQASSCGVGAGVIAISAGGAVWPAVLATNWSHPASAP